jgi:hypothetical protein
MTTEIVPTGQIERRIVVIRGQKVILDADLAALYGVTTKRLNEQVKRNAARFPGDFAFELTDAEAAILRSQNATSSGTHGGRRYRPNVFTEHGAVMAASVLNTPRAVEISVYVVRAFIRLREALATHAEIAHKVAALERKMEDHDAAIGELIEIVERLTEPPAPGPSRRIGFQVDPDKQT